jgi:hypothetical protein
MNPDIKYFGESGTWVKPAGAVRVDIVLQGGQAAPLAGVRMPIVGPPGGFTTAHLGNRVNVNGIVCSNGNPGDTQVSSWNADEIEDTVEVEVGNGGRPGGRDGYALIVTHLASPPLPSTPPHDLILHAHPDPGDDEPHVHLHTGPGHGGIEHTHPHRHAAGESG